MVILKHHYKSKLSNVKHHHKVHDQKRRELSWNYRYWREKFGKLKKVPKIAVTFGIPAVVGCDPTTTAFVLAAILSSTSSFKINVKSTGEQLGVNLGVNFGRVNLGVNL